LRSFSGSHAFLVFLKGTLAVPTEEPPSAFCNLLFVRIPNEFGIWAVYGVRQAGLFTGDPEEEI
jgi:hypothetical protein